MTLGMMFLVLCYRDSEVHGLMCNNGVYVRPRLYIEPQFGRFYCFALRSFEGVDPPWVISFPSYSSVYDDALRVPVPVPLVELGLVDGP